jgi:hypothetical protein
MKAYIITLIDDYISKKAADRCIVSYSRNVSTFPDINIFPAVTAKDAQSLLKQKKLKWTYPWDKTLVDFGLGLKLHPYTTKDPNKRIACFLSHYLLWEKCIELNEPIVILEHDSLWISKIDYQPLLNSHYGVIGLNDPRGATRKANLYHEKIQASSLDILPVPMVDSFDVPQGLAGNSAYIIKPDAAKSIISKVIEIGAWPNDAIMCKQIFDFLGVTKKYYTKVQGLPSTTTL